MLGQFRNLDFKPVVVDESAKDMNWKSKVMVVGYLTALNAHPVKSIRQGFKEIYESKEH